MFPRAKKNGTLPPFLGTLPLHFWNNVEPMRVTGENIRWNITNRSEGSDRKRRKAMTRRTSEGTGFHSKGSAPLHAETRYGIHAIRRRATQGTGFNGHYRITFFRAKKSPPKRASN